jgi:uncharacterized membrane protein YtjA (UPF0391 family)
LGAHDDWILSPRQRRAAKERSVSPSVLSRDGDLRSIGSHDCFVEDPDLGRKLDKFSLHASHRNHRRMDRKQLFDFGGINIEAAGEEKILFVIRNAHIALIILRAHIVGMQPTLRIDGFGGGAATQRCGVKRLPLSAA